MGLPDALIGLLRKHALEQAAERAVTGVMGRSSTGMAARYQHITQAVRQDIAAQVDGLIWPTAANLQWHRLK